MQSLRKTLTTFKYRFFWKDETQRFVPFLPFFTVLNLLVGVLFTFGHFIPGIAELQLFTVLTAFLPAPLTAVIWGVALILVFAGHCAEMYWRGKNYGPKAAMGGVILWCYALGVYLSAGSIMGIMTIVAPQLFFWGWYYLESKAYNRAYAKVLERSS